MSLGQAAGLAFAGKISISVVKLSEKAGESSSAGDALLAAEVASWIISLLSSEGQSEAAAELSFFIVACIIIYIRILISTRLRILVCVKLTSAVKIWELLH
jgi:hypothetical protein